MVWTCLRINRFTVVRAVCWHMAVYKLSAKKSRSVKSSSLSSFFQPKSWKFRSKAKHPRIEIYNPGYQKTFSYPPPCTICFVPKPSGFMLSRICFAVYSNGVVLRALRRKNPCRLLFLWTWSGGFLCCVEMTDC
jgi:hypothetical protein